MPVDVVTRLVIDAPPELVSRYLGDPTNLPEWQRCIRLSYSYEVLELVPERRLLMRTVGGPCPIETTYAWCSFGDDMTQVTIRRHGEPRGVWRFASSLMALVVRRENLQDQQHLKRELDRAEVIFP
ncbi:MAG TPA: ATPase [Polyangia bacterium]|nr:ATPase [Polyangia bacterium]